MVTVSKEAFDILKEIIRNETIPDYWKQRFCGLSIREDSILRGCFSELEDADLIFAKWADGYPYFIQVLKDGYLYEKNIQATQNAMMGQFERELNSLLERAKSIKKPTNIASIGTDISEYNRPSDEWINDVEIFYNRYLKEHALARRMDTLLNSRSLDSFTQLGSCLKSIAGDKEFIETMSRLEGTTTPAHQPKNMHTYDVFLSHANADKQDFVDELNSSLEKLGIDIFYDKKALDWGDNWKERILVGTKQAAFAIIVISENFFDREWTERELKEFLTRQNRNGQKLILPIVHNISKEELRKKYPSVSEIQMIDSNDFTCDEIALLFARQLIKRLKAER